jgi:hypothetical protein
MIKTLKIEFEGLESVEVNGEYIKQFKRIDNVCLDENGNISETRKLFVVLDSKANKEYGGFSSERTIFDRITGFNDIVCFVMQDDESEHIVFTNYEEDCAGNNKNQYTMIDGDGNLHILITDDKKLVPGGFTQPDLIPISEVTDDENC